MREILTRGGLIFIQSVVLASKLILEFIKLIYFFKILIGGVSGEGILLNNCYSHL